MENRPGGERPTGHTPGPEEGQPAPGPFAGQKEPSGDGGNAAHYTAHEIPRAPYAAPTGHTPGPYVPHASYYPPPGHYPDGSRLPLGERVQPPPVRPRSRDTAGIMFGTFVAGAVALVALAASVLMVVSTPREEPPPGGTDLSAHYGAELHEQPEPVEIDIVGHPFYDVAAPEDVVCDTPALDMGSDESWEAFAAASGECLDALWEPVMDELGLTPEPLEFAVTDERLDTDDEDGYTLAYYEGDYSRITMVLPNVRRVGAQIPEDEHEAVWLTLMAHEYGHHVQYATGILTVSHDLRRDAGSEDDELDTLRRTELQAECLAGIGLRGILDDPDARDVANEHFNADGDLDTHGSADNRAHWLEQGWSGDAMGDCNTYDSESELVT